MKKIIIIMNMYRKCTKSDSHNVIKEDYNLTPKPIFLNSKHDCGKDTNIIYKNSQSFVL